MKTKSILLTALIYGLPIGILLNFLFHILLTGDKAYLGDDRVSLLMFGIVCCVYFFMFKNYSSEHSNSIPRLSHLAALIFCFSTVVATCLGLGHFINATFIDPGWAEKSLALLQERWTANNYSATEIAGQVEWTDTFQNPWKWGLVSLVFFTIMYSIAGMLIGVLFYTLKSFLRKLPQKTRQQSSF